MSTANIHTYTPSIYNTVYIITIRHCKHLSVVVYKFISCNMYIYIYIYIYTYIYIYIYMYIHTRICCVMFRLTEGAAIPQPANMCYTIT